LPFTGANGKVRSNMAQQTDNILTNGEWLAHRYDAEGDTYQMRLLSREAHDSATFITDEYLGVEESPAVLARSEAMQSVSKDNDLHFILHSAFCASTMFARGFNLPGVSMGLKEPVLLNDIVGWRRRGAAPSAVAERLDHGLHMLARPFPGDAAVIVKPSNVFNALAPLALAMRPATKAVLLYAPLPVFLISVARKGLWCRLWVRELLEGLMTDGIVDLGFEPQDYFRQSDLQVAAIGWLAQHRLFQQMIDKYGAARILALDSETLTADPANAVKAAARHFGLAVRDSAIEGHSAFTTHSKFGGSFRTDDRRAEYDLAQQAHNDEIEKVLVWAEAVAKAAGISLDLSAPLLAAQS
jgi:hypothetical protein